MTQRAVFEIGVDLLDDRMLAVGFVRGDGVQIAGGEEGVEAVRVEQCRLPVAGERVELADPPHDEAPVNAVRFLLSSWT